MSLKTFMKITGVGGAVYSALCIKRKQEVNRCSTLSQPSHKIDPHDTENFYFMKNNVQTAWYETEEVKNQLKSNEQRFDNVVGEVNGKIQCKMVEVGAPCMMVAVSVNGKIVMNKGYGYVDLEKRHSAGWTHPVRIGHISHNITLAVLARLWKDGKLDPQKKVSEYIPDFEEDMSMTVKELLEQIFLNDKSKMKILIKLTEKIVGEKFEKYMTDQFKVLGMENTYLENSEIIYWRANHYYRDKKYKLKNADVSEDYREIPMFYLSSVVDLARFGNILLYSSQKKDTTDESNGKDEASNDDEPREKDKYLPGYLSREFLSMVGYGVNIQNSVFGFCQKKRNYAIMTGDDPGASSVLLIIDGNDGNDLFELPKGVVVSILCNLEDVKLEPLAVEIALSFLNLGPNMPFHVQDVQSC